MKILVFEYVSGGGFNREPLPAALASEGLLMLNALLEGLNKIPGVEVTAMLDVRLLHQLHTSTIGVAVVAPQDDCFERFRQLAERHDAVWPIAPEFDKILLTLCQMVERTGKILLVPGSEAVRLAADKYETFACLVRRQIPAVATRLLDDCPAFPGDSIIKPIDGVGCDDSYVLRNADDFDRVAARLRGTRKYIIQPHLDGEKTSLSCLFKEGKAWLLSVNLQCFEMASNQYRLSAIQVNHRYPMRSDQALVDNIAQAVPGLWGYAGIDLIETPEQAWVLEINPRLTSSFAGIDAAFGINVVELVLQLLNGDPNIQRTANKTVTVQIKQEADDK